MTEDFYHYDEFQSLLQDKSISEIMLKKVERNMLELLVHPNKLIDKTLDAYINLLSEKHPEYIPNFMHKAYQIIDGHIEVQKELTPNMIVLDCYMIKDMLNITIPISFDFYNDVNDDSFIKHNAGNISINMESVSQIYQEYNNKRLATLYILFALGHELEHVYMLEHESDIFDFVENQRDYKLDKKLALRMFNIRISKALYSVGNEEIYKFYHDSFVHEHDCNIVGLQLLNDRYNLFPSITSDDKREFNKIIASIFLNAYSHRINGKLYYLSPVDFTKFNYNNEKENIPNYQRLLLLKLKELPMLLQSTEEQLTEEEKFIFGYYTPYINILNMISNNIITSDDILEDLPNFYQKYYGQSTEAKDSVIK